MNKLFISFLLILSNGLFAQEGFIEKNTSIKNAVKLRDPFKPPKTTSAIKDISGTSMKEGVFTNVLSPDSLALSNIKVKGVLLGERKRVIITTDQLNAPTYMLAEGTKISNGTVELKAILPSGVIFVEKITNVYGQLEYLETVVPISK